MIRPFLKINIIMIFVFLVPFVGNFISVEIQNKSNDIGILKYEKDIKSWNAYHEHFIVAYSLLSRNPETSLQNEEYYSAIINDEIYKNEFNFALIIESGSLGKNLSVAYNLYDINFNPIVLLDEDPDNYDGETFVSRNSSWSGNSLKIRVDYRGFDNVSYIHLRINASWQPPNNFASESIFETVFRFSS